jgi:hypothetical protein
MRKWRRIVAIGGTVNHVFSLWGMRQAVDLAGAYIYG